MNEHERYYRERLYPLQDGILSFVAGLKLPFYLTGGTALSRAYLNHRFSEDIDLFVDDDPEYHTWVGMFMEALEKKVSAGGLSIERQATRTAESFTMVVVRDRVGTALKIDLVNDIAARTGRTSRHSVLGRIDSWRNILSNKISALFRFEPKDMADLWALATTRRFSWRTMIEEAKRKEGGVDPLLIHEIVGSFPVDNFSKVKWITPPDPRSVVDDIQTMARDILAGRNNTLCRR